MPVPLSKYCEILDSLDPKIPGQYLVVICYVHAEFLSILLWTLVITGWKAIYSKFIIFYRDKCSQIRTICIKIMQIL